MESPSCRVPDCGRPTRLAGLCGAHHQRLLRHGDVRAHIPLRGHDQPTGLLWCSRCQASKSADDFYRNRTTRTGRDGVCKACVDRRRRDTTAHRAAVRRAWRDRNRERINARKREDWKRADRAARREASRAWRAANPERTRQQIRAQNAARYARIKEAPGHATTEQIAARWAYYGDRCWMCGAPATDTDHVKPLAAGGSNWPANLRPACSPCNRAKSGAWPYPLEVARGRATLRREGTPGSRPATSVDYRLRGVGAVGEDVHQPDRVGALLPPGA